MDNQWFQNGFNNVHNETSLLRFLLSIIKAREASFPRRPGSYNIILSFKSNVGRPARLPSACFSFFHSLALTGISFSERPLLHEIRGGSQFPVFSLLDAFFSGEFVSGLALMVDMLRQKPRFIFFLFSVLVGELIHEAQFRHIKIQLKTIDLSTRLWWINPTNSVVIPWSLVLRYFVPLFASRANISFNYGQTLQTRWGQTIDRCRR